MAESKNNQSYFTPEEAQHRPEDLAESVRARGPRINTSAVKMPETPPSDPSNQSEQDRFFKSLTLQRAVEVAKKKNSPSSSGGQVSSFINRQSDKLEKAAFSPPVYSSSHHQIALHPPSILLYYCLLVVAFWSDVIGIALTAMSLTGILYVISGFIKFVISFFFYMVSRHLGRQLNDMRVSSEDLLQAVEIMQSRIKQYLDYADRLVKLSKKSGIGKKVMTSSFWRGRTMGIVKSSFDKASSWLKSPTKKSLISGVAEIIPIIDLLPWYTINVIWTYYDHKKTYKDALESKENFQETNKLEVEVLSDVSLQETLALIERELNQPVE